MYKWLVIFALYLISAVAHGLDSSEYRAINALGIYKHSISTLKININNSNCYATESHFVGCIQASRMGLAMMSSTAMALVSDSNQIGADFVRQMGPMVIVKTNVPAELLVSYYAMAADQQLKSETFKADRLNLVGLFNSIQSGRLQRLDFDQLISMIHFDSQGNEQDLIREDLLVSVMSQVYTESYLPPDEVKRNFKYSDSATPSRIEMIVSVGGNRIVKCGTGCWDQPPLPNQWQRDNFAGSIGFVYTPWNFSVEYHDFGRVNVNGTFVDDNHWDNRGFVRPGALYYTAIVKQQLKGISFMYSPPAHKFDSDRFGKWAISTPYGILFFDNRATFQAFDYNTKQYLWPELPNGTISQHNRGATWTAAIQAAHPVGAAQIGFRLNIVGALGPAKKDAPGGGAGRLQPGIYELGIFYKMPVL